MLQEGAKMKYTESKAKTAAELATMLKEKKVLLLTLKQQLQTMQLTTPTEISEVTKDIARINTAITAVK